MGLKAVLSLFKSLLLAWNLKKTLPDGSVRTGETDGFTRTRGKTSNRLYCITFNTDGWPLARDKSLQEARPAVGCTA